MHSTPGQQGTGGRGKKMMLSINKNQGRFCQPIESWGNADPYPWAAVGKQEHLIEQKKKKKSIPGWAPRMVRSRCCSISIM